MSYYHTFAQQLRRECIDSDEYSDNPTIAELIAFLMSSLFFGGTTTEQDVLFGSISFINRITAWVSDISNYNNYITSIGGQLATALYFQYFDYEPAYQCWESELNAIKRNLSIGNAKLPNYLNYSFLEGLLKKYNLPSDFILDFISSQNVDYSSLDDFISDRILNDIETTQRNGTDKTENTGTLQSTDTGEGSGKQWQRTRPINYQTTDETTADTVQGQNSTSTGTTNSTTTNDGTRTIEDTTERNRALTERKKSIMSLVKELGDVLKPIIPELVKACAPCFVQEVGI